MGEPNVAISSVRPWTLVARRRRLGEETADASAATSIAIKAVIGSRLIVWAAALVALAIFGRDRYAVPLYDPNGFTEPFRAAWANFIFAPTARWDSAWYLWIGHSGYFSRSSSAFFPLYPILLHLGAIVFGSELVVGMLISLIAMTIGLYVLYLLARLDLTEEQARMTVLLLALFPTSFFFSAVYSESLFVALSVGAIYAARQDRWALASLLGALAAATRSTGVLIALPLVLMYLYGPRGATSRAMVATVPRAVAAQWWRPRYRLSASSAWLLLIPVGLCAYLGYLFITHDAPFAPFQAERYWDREFAGPLGALVRLAKVLPGDVHRIFTGHTVRVDAGDWLSWNTHDLIDVGFLVFALVGVALAWRRVPFAYFAYAIVLLAQALSEPDRVEPLASFSRYLLIMFPIFMGWGAWLGGRRLRSWAMLGFSAVLLVFFSALWGMWIWVA
jgi:hypothetical protein